LRLLWDILHRRGAPIEIFQIPGVMPLMTIGSGPILLITFLDDPHPRSQSLEGGPPEITGDAVKAPGITRTAGLLAVLGAALEDVTMLRETTVVIEADRHAGSFAIESWLRAVNREYSAALWEVVDLPAPAPAVYATASGIVTMRVSISVAGRDVESFFGGVQPDAGHLLVDTLAALKSSDAEVLVPGFYDGVASPDSDGLRALNSIAPFVGAWLTRGSTPNVDRLSPSHLTLGTFVTPSITIRELRMDDASPYLSRSASAVIEARVMPGQNVFDAGQAIGEFIRARVPDATIEQMTIRPPTRVASLDQGAFASIAPTIPVAPGSSPAGLLDAAGVPTVGFSTVWRNPELFEESVTLTAIQRGSATITSLIQAVSGWRARLELARR
jgi:hypothetical protein